MALYCKLFLQAVLPLTGELTFMHKISWSYVLIVGKTHNCFTTIDTVSLRLSTYYLYCSHSKSNGPTSNQSVTRVRDEECQK